MVVCIVVTDSCRVAAWHVYMYQSGEFDVRRELFMFHSCYDIQLLAVHDCVHMYLCFKTVHFISVIDIGPM